MLECCAYNRRQVVTSSLYSQRQTSVWASLAYIFKPETPFYLQPISQVQSSDLPHLPNLTPWRGKVTSSAALVNALSLHSNYSNSVSISRFQENGSRIFFCAARRNWPAISNSLFEKKSSQVHHSEIPYWRAQMVAERRGWGVNRILRLVLIARSQYDLFWIVKCISLHYIYSYRAIFSLILRKQAFQPIPSRRYDFYSLLKNYGAKLSRIWDSTFSNAFLSKALLFSVKSFRISFTLSLSRQRFSCVAVYSFILYRTSSFFIPYL